MEDNRPFFYRADGPSVGLNGLYQGRSLFMVAGGPSFGDDARFPKEPLRTPGVVTFGLNNSPRVFRPNLWTSVDDPSHFLASIWFDPLITKFVPMTNKGKKILDTNSARDNGTLFTPKETWTWYNDQVSGCPNTVFYKRNDNFRPETYLTEPTINWGNSKTRGGGRSVLLAAIRIAYILGFRRVFLLGVDFEMSATSTYSFSQQRLPGSVSGNNSTYKLLKDRFEKLQPIFLKSGLQVYNCNERSALQVFPHMPYLEALKRVAEEDMRGINVAEENTEGLYDRVKRSEKPKPRGRVKDKSVSQHAYTQEEKDAAQKNLNEKRRILNELKKNPAMQHEVPKARIAFRAAEDEKRWKHGQPIKWGRWTPDKGV